LLLKLSSNIQSRPLIKTETIENIIVDEVNKRTYVVMAERILSDGELYRIIRLEILSREPLAKGERLVISASKWIKAPKAAMSGKN